MFNNMSNIMFLIITMMSSMMAISCNSWMMSWISLEINLFFFIPIIYMFNKFNSESSIKYFMIQVISSMFMLISIINWKNNFYYNSNIMMDMALLSKMGSVPLHMWFIQIIESMNWLQFLMVSTWQKLAPLIMILNYFNNMLMKISIITNSLLGSLGGMNQMSMKKLFGFSSINHLSWMLMTSLISEQMMMIYFFVYSWSMFLISYMLFNKNLWFSNMMMNKKNKLSLILFSMLFLSMGGMPPFIGFIPKWIIIQMMMINNQYFMLLMILIFSTMNLYYYFRLFYLLLLLNNLKINFNLKFNNNIYFFLYIYMNISFMIYILMNLNY
uniref:NADH-ubiquinone oxidoreductase chain 2 n=1 Tax=Ecnomus latus TaxID=623472 RepID=A0A9E8LQ04_9NEOP|nr:NADH dehydrogenase subunit 2 [Ecnomus latus]UZZ43896.1 NADH dehydrogenase subunit 2 [Ecnomus latus]